MVAFVPDEAIRRGSEISPSAFRLFAYYCLRRNKDGICYPSLKTTAADLQMTYTRVSRWRRELVERGWIAQKGDRVTPIMGFVGANESCRNGKDVAESALINVAETATEFAESATTFAESANAYRKNQPINQPIEPKRAAARARAQGEGTEQPGSRYSREEIDLYLAGRSDLRSREKVARILYRTGEDDDRIEKFLADRGRPEETDEERRLRLAANYYQRQMRVNH